MAEVASAFVSVMPSAKGFGSKLNSEIGGDLDSSGKKAGSRFGTALKTGALGLLAGAGVAAGAFLKGSIDEAREAQKVGALTESTIKATGHAAGVTAKQVGDLAGAISLKTGIDDETIQSGQNMLLTFKNIRNEAGKGNDIFTQSTKTLVDLSAAMGTEPKQAAIQLGKALNDPVKGVSALSRVGVTFTEGQKKVIGSLVESGKTAEAQKIILGELNSEFGGAAEAQATAGDKMKVAWGNLEESAGTALLPLVDSIMPKLTDAMTWLASDGVDGAKDFAGQALDLGRDLKDDLLPPLKTLGGIARDVAGFLADLPGPVKTFGAEALVAAFILPKLSAGFDTAKTKATALGTSLKNAETRMATLKSAAGTAAGVGGVLLLSKAAGTTDAKMKTLYQTVGGAATGFAIAGPIGALIGGTAGGLLGIAAAGSKVEDFFTNARTETLNFKDAINQATGALEKQGSEMILLSAQKEGIANLATRMGINERDLIGAVNGNVAATRRLNDAYDKHFDLLSGTEQGDWNAWLRDNITALADTRRETLHNNAVLQGWKKSLKGLPPKVQTKVQAIGVDISKKQIRDLKKQYDLSPKQVRTIVKAVGTEETIKKVHGVWKVLDATGKVKGNLDTWQSSLLAELNGTRGKMDPSLKGIVKVIEAGPKSAKADLDPLSASLTAGLGRVQGQARTGGLGVGNDLKSGVITGFSGTGDQLAADAAAAVTQAIEAARRAADAHSPSRKMIALGQDMGDGLSIGIDNRRGRVAQSLDRLAGGMTLRRPSFAGSAAVATAGGGGGAAVVNIYDVDGVLMGTMDGRIEAHADLAGQRARAM